MLPWGATWSAVEAGGTTEVKRLLEALGHNAAQIQAVLDEVAVQGLDMKEYGESLAISSQTLRAMGWSDGRIQQRGPSMVQEQLEKCKRMTLDGGIRSLDGGAKHGKDMGVEGGKGCRLGVDSGKGGKDGAGKGKGAAKERGRGCAKKLAAGRGK